MLKRVLAVLMVISLLSVLLFSGCGRLQYVYEPDKETPTPTPTPTPTHTPTPTPSSTPTPQVSEEEKPWEKDFREGYLGNEIITQEEYLTRVVHLPNNTGTVEETFLFGYLPDDSITTKKIKQLCEDYINATYNYHYETVTGTEEWWLFTQELYDLYTAKGVAEAMVKTIKDDEVISESKGITKFIDIVVVSSGLTGFAIFEFKVKEEGKPEYMSTLELNDDGTETVTVTLGFEMVDNSYKIFDIRYNKKTRVEIPKVQ